MVDYLIIKKVSIPYNSLHVVPLLLLLCMLVSCVGKSTDIVENTSSDSIPEGAIPFEYDFKMKRQIIIPGTLNDSIPMKYWFETGARIPIFSDSLNFKKKDLSLYEERVYSPMKIRIGNWERTYGDTINPAYYVNKNHQRVSGIHLLFEWYGNNSAVITWQFFKNKIIEISFSNLYIREIDDFTDFSEFEGIKLENENNFLGIPVVIFTQGKEIKEILTFDTGFNGGITLNRNLKTKYNLETDYLKVDTLKIGNDYLMNNISFGFPSKKIKHKFPFSGLMGTKILENFDMVLDLKNYYLYLKPVEKSN